MARLSLGKGLAFAAIALVVAAVATGLSLIESPESRRALRADQHRAEDLESLVKALNCFWTLDDEKSLPADLPTLVEEIDKAAKQHGLPKSCLPRAIADPVTGQPYRYRVRGGAAFELCATFARASDTDEWTFRMPRSGKRAWHHDAGEHCFRLKVEKIDLPGVTPKD